MFPRRLCEWPEGARPSRDRARQLAKPPFPSQLPLLGLTMWYFLCPNPKAPLNGFPSCRSLCLMCRPQVERKKITSYFQVTGSPSEMVMEGVRSSCCYRDTFMCKASTYFVLFFDNLETIDSQNS